jgi:hypothetical protein
MNAIAAAKGEKIRAMRKTFSLKAVLALLASHSADEGLATSKDSI